MFYKKMHWICNFLIEHFEQLLTLNKLRVSTFSFASLIQPILAQCRVN